jgi:uncharacterized protein YhfF
MEQITVRKLWQDFLEAAGDNEATTEKKYTAWHFCDNEKDADELADLVIQGIKRATASLFLAYETEREDLPKVGDYSIITDWAGRARCIIQTVRIEIVPFGKVTPEFAATEGEGDKSLKYWRGAHWAYFSREMKELGMEPSEDMMVVCEEFKVAYS